MCDISRYQRPTCWGNGNAGPRLAKVEMVVESGARQPMQKAGWCLRSTTPGACAVPLSWLAVASSERLDVDGDLRHRGCQGTFPNVPNALTNGTSKTHTEFSKAGGMSEG